MNFYPKKRRKPGPSKNDEKVRRAESEQANDRAAGTLSSRFPTLRSLVVRVTVATPQGAILEDSEETYGPNDPFRLQTDCPGSCGSGIYDFSPLVAQSLQTLQDRGTAQIICAKTSYSGAPGTLCGCVAKCEFAADVAAS